MAKRIGLFVDVSNLYYCISKKYKNRKLDYRKYKKFVADLGEIQQAIAYGAQMSSQANGFIYCLKQIGFQTKYKTPKVYPGEGSNVKRKADWDVGIAMDIVNMIDRFDMIILGTGDGDMLPVVQWVMRRGVDVVILASGISRDLKNYATKCIEIPESLLEANKPKGAKTPSEMVDQSIKEGKDPEAEGDVRKSLASRDTVANEQPKQATDTVQDSIPGASATSKSIDADGPSSVDETAAADLGKHLGI